MLSSSFAKVHLFELPRDTSVGMFLKSFNKLAVRVLLGLKSLVARLLDITYCQAEKHYRTMHSLIKDT